MADEDDVMLDDIDEQDQDDADRTDDETDSAAGADDEQQASPSEIEALAAEIGWAPQDQWRGDPEDWKSAEEFLRGNVQATKALRETVKRQDTRLEEMTDTMRRMNAASEKANQRAYERAVADLKAQQRAAVEEGDAEAYDRAEQEIAALEKDAPAAGNGEDKGPQNDPDFIAFQQNHPWYGGATNQDIRKTVFADQIAPGVARHYQGAAFYAKIAEMVDEEFKEQGANPARQRANRVESGGQMRRGSNGKKTYNDLPADAKAACDNFVADGVTTRDQYVEDFFAQE